MSPVVYLKKLLGFTAREWMALSLEDRETLVRWAREEMAVLGLQAKEA